MEASLFSHKFLESLKSLITQHHRLYPQLPPQGIFFESLVQLAFKKSGWAVAQVVASSPNSPKHDLLVGEARLSIKSETGRATRAHSIGITKLCTTETGWWEPKSLVQHVLGHLSRYDRMLMLRAIWRFRKAGKSKILHAFHYQLLEVPLNVLKLIGTATIKQVGHRKGERKSLAGDALRDGAIVLHVHFDGADGKCQVRKLAVEHCKMLLEWEQPIRTS